MGPHPDRPRRPQKHSDATEQRLALDWREIWRSKKTETEKAGANAANKPDAEKKRRARFAAGIARSEFGRHYWDARREAGIPKRPGDG